MTERQPATVIAIPEAEQTGGPAPEREQRDREFAVLAALAEVVDPELGMNVVDLALIKQVIIGSTSSEVRMILTTPFCPYAGEMIAQVQAQAESALGHPVKVTLLAERWNPQEAGLIW
jgi:metal-sulfur cluster biosynthetic enzyme